MFFFLKKAKNLDLLKVDSFMDPFLHLHRIWMLSTCQRLTKVHSSSTAYLTLLIPIQDQLLKTSTSLVKCVRSVGKTSKPQLPQSLQSQSQSPHPSLAVLPPTAVPSPITALSSSNSPIPTSPPDFSSQSSSSATTRS